MTRHIVVQAEVLLRCEAERPAHQQLRRGEGGTVIGGVFVSDRLLRHGHQPFAAFDVPLAPVSKAAQFHIGHKAVGAQKRRQRTEHAVMGGTERLVGIVRRVAFPIRRIVPAAIPRLCIKPVRDIQMRLFPRHIADEAQHQMDPLLPQCRKAVFLL